MNTRLKEVGGRAALKGAATPAEQRLLESDMFVGPDFMPDDIVIRRMLLCHDQYDRTLERFPAKMLKRLAETITGRSVLAAHDTGGWLGGGSLPLARFIMGQLEVHEEPAFPVLQNPPAQSKGRSRTAGDTPPPGFAEEPTTVQWLSASFYFPAHESTDALRVHLDTGVYKWVSIGFRYDDIQCDLCKNSYLDYEKCPHRLGKMDENTGLLCTGTYTGNMEQCETLEGSLVYLGGQQRARTTKSMIENHAVDPAVLAYTPYGEDLVILKEAEALAREFGHARKVYAVKSAAEPEQEDTGLEADIEALAIQKAPAGLTLAQHAKAVLADLEAFADRAVAVRDMRSGGKRRERPLGIETMQCIDDMSDCLRSILPLETKEFFTADTLREAGDAAAQAELGVTVETEEATEELAVNDQRARQVKAMLMVHDADAHAFQLT